MVINFILLSYMNNMQKDQGQLKEDQLCGSKQSSDTNLMLYQK